MGSNFFFFLISKVGSNLRVLEAGICNKLFQHAHIVIRLWFDLRLKCQDPMEKDED